MEGIAARVRGRFRAGMYACLLLGALLTGGILAAGCGKGADEIDWTKETPLYQTGKSDSQGRPILVPGDFCPEIAEMQHRVNGLDIRGVELIENGVYDDDTLAVVLAFQYSQGLQPDGVIGSNTWDAIEDPQKAPDRLDPLTLVEIAKVAIESPSDAKQMLADLEGGAPQGGGSPGGSGSGAGTQRAVVKLSEQQVYLYDSAGRHVATLPCSSGRDGLTPVGTFTIQSKSSSTVSNSDPTISMKWMTRFNGSIGFHGIPVKGGKPLDTPLGQAPVSAGCVRMADPDAKTIYDDLPTGTRVEVVY